MTIDWTLLKKPLIFLFSVIILLSLTIHFLWERYEETHRRYENAMSERIESYNRYQRATSDMALFDEYKDDFLAYKSQGIIGEENRLSWAEVLHKQNQMLSLVNFNVNITRRRKIKNDSSSSTMQWYQSNQSIRSGLLHEGDLYQILNVLYNDADGLFRIASCRLVVAREIQIAPQAENISANCELEWFSLELSRQKDD